MKRFIAASLALVGLAGPSWATSKAYDQALVSNQVISSTQNFVIDASSSIIDLLSAQVSLSTASPAAATFKDGHISSGTITVTSATFLSAQAGSDTLTVSTNSALSPTSGSDSILVSSGVTGSSITVTTNQAYILRDNNQYTHVGTTTGTAIAIANAVNTYVANVTATVSGSSVIITCNANGSFCNSYALASSTAAALTVASANFSGGNDNASFNLNGDVFYQGSDWFQTGTASGTAVSILNSLTRADFTASTPTSTSVQIQCATKGSFCNSFTLTSSTGALSVNSANFTGGQNNAYIVINGTKLTQGTDFTAGSSSASAANAIATAINANSTLSSIVVATAPLACGLSSPCGVVYTTGTITTGNNNYVWQASSGMTLDATTLTTGVASAYKLNSGSIALPAHGMATNMQVLFTGTNAPTGLAANTTYYVIAVDPNDIELALTSTGAIAGTFITLTSTPAVGGDTFTLTPLAMTGSLIVTWQGSNDNVNWANLNVSTASIGASGAPNSTAWDFGSTNMKFYRANVAGPVTGGVNTTIRAYGKRYGSGL